MSCLTCRIHLVASVVSKQGNCPRCSSVLNVCEFWTCLESCVKTAQVDFYLSDSDFMCGQCISTSTNLAQVLLCHRIGASEQQSV